MAVIDFNHYHELAEQFRGVIPLKQLYEQKGIRYRDYRLWHNSMDIPRVSNTDSPQPRR